MGKFTAAGNNSFFSPPGEGPIVSDGYWLLLNLPIGENNLSFRGSVDLSELGADLIFIAGASNNLYVIEENK